MDTTNDEGQERIWGGAFLISREIYTSPVWNKHPLYLKAWMLMIGRANHADRARKGHMYHRGEFVTTYDEIIRALTFYHRRKHVMPTLKVVRNILDWFESEKMINVQPIRGFELPYKGRHSVRIRAYVGLKVTIVNYDTYQDFKNYRGRHSGRPSALIGHDNNNLINKEIGSPQKQGDPGVKEFLNYWGETFLQKTGHPYTFTFGKDGKLIKSLLKVHSIETLEEMIQVFFKDEQCRRRGLSIGIFYQEINRLFTIRATNPLEQVRKELMEGGTL